VIYRCLFVVDGSPFPRGLNPSPDPLVMIRCPLNVLTYLKY
jgi:hypothetical protein